MYPDDFLQPRLQARTEQQALRTLRLADGKEDYCSNDYLGIVHDRLIKLPDTLPTGSTGSRLLAGNSVLMEETEALIARFHEAETALLFNSGYDANLGLLSSIATKNDTILYDYLSHASIRDGIRLSLAQSWSFAHNDLNELEEKLRKARGNIFVVTESVFSMDGDTCPLPALVSLCEQYGAHLIIDEAHATGVIGEQGEGLVQACGLPSRIFARIHTFGKACGCHGAVVLGSRRLHAHLVNFARSLIYSTALSPHSVAAIAASYQLFPQMQESRAHLHTLIQQFQQASLPYTKLVSETPIQGLIIPGNEAARAAANRLQEAGFDVRPILYPTVPAGAERLRIVLHAFNQPESLAKLVEVVGGFWFLVFGFWFGFGG